MILLVFKNFTGDTQKGLDCLPGSVIQNLRSSCGRGEAVVESGNPYLEDRKCDLQKED